MKTTYRCIHYQTEPQCSAIIQNSYGD